MDRATHRLGAILGTVLLSFTVAASGQVVPIANTLGPGDTYDGSSALVVGDQRPGGPNRGTTARAS